MQQWLNLYFRQNDFIIHADCAQAFNAQILSRTHGEQFSKAWGKLWVKVWVNVRLLRMLQDTANYSVLPWSGDYYHIALPNMKAE